MATFQGAVQQSRAALPSSSSTKAAAEQLPDPLLICSAAKRIRFYLFTRREPSDTEIDKVGRDLMNERLTSQASHQ